MAYDNSTFQTRDPKDVFSVYEKIVAARGFIAKTVRSALIQAAMNLYTHHFHFAK